MRGMRIASVFTALSVSILSLALACGGDDDGDGGSNTDAGSEDADAGDDGGDDDDGGDGDADGGADGGPVLVCGGLAGIMCEDTHYCDWPDDSCGAIDQMGQCKPRPAECEPDNEPVCACDGSQYDNACAAAMAGSDVSGADSCAR
jgi:hypothetical protein